MKMFGLYLSLFYISLFGCVHGVNEFCVSPPDLYYANVNGLIPGGYNNLIKGDQSPCTKDIESLRYRELDGRCNHPKDYGSTLKPLKRYLPADYHDEKGWNTPRLYSVVGNVALPSPRLISWKLFPDISINSDLSMFTMQFGQFLSHDIGVAPVPTSPNHTITCCQVSSRYMNRDCFPIPIPKGDPRFQKCMEFVRSEAAKDDDGNQINPREQLNALTSFVDSSTIYGSNLGTSLRLRTENGKGALLLTTLIHGKERLPNDTSSPPACLRTESPTSYCQLSGDGRVNQQPVLSTQHLSFHLYHNYIVRQLAKGILKRKGFKTSPAHVEKYIKTVSEKVKEMLFQEARKIVGAIFQKIAFCDYLPYIVGPELIVKFDLGCDTRSKYNPHIDPRIANGFLAGAYRFGHTLISNSYTVNGAEEFFKDEFFIPDSSIDSHEDIIAGMLNTSKGVHFDRFFANGITEHLFETKVGPKKALDLASVNIQRGRDHGIPAYLHWRKKYNLRPLTDFEDFSKQCSQILSQLYRNIYDVDLYPGGICEPSVTRGVVGETFGHIIADQFSDLKFGDRFFFTHVHQYPQGFNDDQLAAILDFSSNALLCFSGKLSVIQENTWLKVSPDNPLVPCSTFDQIDVQPWVRELVDHHYF
ncbi:chorion peroxidase-like [Biomphalaria glabrata]|uniref:Chorion peroxidase-like n=1 Tax=Biomphalaria glabrata TaxID=6526 RepID=A0A9W3AAH5_BIOGL|nr:chorion peroxidase-like [Biomphalaria glabrata]